MPTAEPKIGALPDQVVYFNQWTGFNNRAIAELFRCIPLEELVRLPKNATIWIDAEQPSGKVYGYNRAEITSVEDYGDRVMIEYAGPCTNGCIPIKRSAIWHKIYKCTDLERLVELVNESPLATETGTSPTASDEYVGTYR